jgi:hypothetical protein
MGGQELFENAILAMFFEKLFAEHSAFVYLSYRKKVLQQLG